MKKLLSPKESKIFILLAKGYSKKTISKKLDIAYSTTKTHVESIYNKLKVNNKMQAVIKAIYLKVFDINELIDETTLLINKN